MNHIVAANDNGFRKYGPWLPTRKMAIKHGAKTYLTGQPCRNGHISFRNVSDWKCHECCRAQWERNRRKNGEQPFQPNMEKRAAAKNGERYYVGQPCPHGHEGKRWTHNGACFDCTNIAANDHAKRTNYKHRRAYEARHPERYRTSIANAKARRKGAKGSHSASDIRNIMAMQNGKCAYCRLDVRKIYHLDHINPIALGGTNYRSNLQILCPKCNLKKSASDPIDFARKRGMLL